MLTKFRDWFTRSLMRRGSTLGECGIGDKAKNGSASFDAFDKNVNGHCLGVNTHFIIKILDIKQCDN